MEAPALDAILRVFDRISINYDRRGYFLKLPPSEATSARWQSDHDAST